MTLQVYGIPNCGTCKKAVKWLEAHAVPYEFVNTKLAPPAADTIRTWVEAIGNKPLRNTSGRLYRNLPAKKRDSMADEDWVRTFAAQPMMLKRPIFVRDGVAILTGFGAPETTLQAKLAGNPSTEPVSE